MTSYLSIFQFGLYIGRGSSIAVSLQSLWSSVRVLKALHINVAVVLTSVNSTWASWLCIPSHCHWAHKNLKIKTTLAARKQSRKSSNLRKSSSRGTHRCWSPEQFPCWIALSNILVWIEIQFISICVKCPLGHKYQKQHINILSLKLRIKLWFINRRRKF